MFLSLKTI